MNNIEKLDKKNLLRTVAIVAGPIALQSLIASSLNLIDNLMIGGMGELALNAVGVSIQMFFIYWMFMFGFISGGATYLAQFFGVKDYANIKRTAGFTITVCMGMGILFFIAAEAFPEYVLRIFTKYPEVIEAGVPYLRYGAPCFLINAVSQSLIVGLRATQQTSLPLKASVVALCTNTVLNYGLIYGKLGLPCMEIRGAALATVFSRIVEFAIIIYFIWGKDNVLKGSFKEYFSFSKDLALRVTKTALPTTINETMWGIGTSMYIAAFARVSISAGAAVQACNTVNNIFSMAAFSIGDAILILVGQKLGEGKLDIAYDMAKFLVKLGVIIGVVLGGCCMILSKPILGLFDFTEEGARDAWCILMVYAATLWIEVLNATLVTGALRCGGDTRFAMFIEVGCVWIIGVPVAFITSLVIHWPIFIAVLCVKGEAAIESIILILRFVSKKWLNNLVNEIS